MKSIKTTILLAAVAAFIISCTAVSPELRSARIATSERDWDRAIRNANQELAIRPNSGEALYILGYAYEMKRNWVAMADAYTRSLTAGPEFTGQITESENRILNHFLSKATTAYDSTRYDDAFAFIDTALIIKPDNLDAYQNGAVIAYHTGDYGKSENFAKKAISLEKPGQKPDETMRELLLLAARNREDITEAYNVAKELLTILNPDSSKGAYLNCLDAVVNYYEWKGNNITPASISQGIASSPIPDRFPTKTTFIEETGDTTFTFNGMQNQWDITKSVGGDSIATVHLTLTPADLAFDPASVDTISLVYKLMQGAERKKYDDMAIEAITKASNHYPDILELKINLAVLLNRTGNNAEAENIYKDLLKAKPDDKMVLTNLAYILLQQKRFSEAIPLLKSALDADPNNKILMQNLMAAYYNSGQDKEGKELADRLNALNGGK